MQILCVNRLLGSMVYDRAHTKKKVKKSNNKINVLDLVRLITTEYKAKKCVNGMAGFVK